MTEATASRTHNSAGRSRLEQAAILLLSVGDQAAAQVMQKLNREEVVLLSETMARLHDVKVNQARQAMNNFFSDYSEQSGINGASRSYLRSILEKALGGEIARSVINGIYGDEIRYRMARLQWVDTPQLAALIDQEHLQLQAVFLAFLPPDTRGAFAGDASISALSSELSNLLRGTFGEQNMTKFGITADKDGKLSIDSEVLEKQLKNDPQTVAQFFNGNDGLIKSMDKSLDKYLSTSSGLLKGRQETLDRQQTDIDTKTEKMNTRYRRRV